VHETLPTPTCLCSPVQKRMLQAMWPLQCGNRQNSILQTYSESALQCQHRQYQMQDEVQRMLSCGHIKAMECGANEETEQCVEPCQTTLNCDHVCGGTCGTCQQGKIHIACTSKCGRLLVCSHLCPEPCTKNCPPCKKPCGNRCVHGICQKQCGQVCVPCKEPCQWYCPHIKCELLCGDVCQRPRCNKPCPKVLKCGHPCRGMCGELCAKSMCTICNPSIKEIFFGNEEDEDARFVQLQDCSHIFEVTMMDHYMDSVENGGAIKLKECPQCKTPIRRSFRYGNSVKQALANIEKVKIKAAELQAILENLVNTLQEKVNQQLGNPDMQPVKVYLTVIKGRLKKRLAEDEVAVIQNQLNFFPSFGSFLKTLLNFPPGTTYVEMALKEHTALMETLTRQNLSEQQFSELSSSLKILAMKVDVEQLLTPAKFQLLQEDTSFLQQLRRELQQPMKEEERLKKKERLDKIKRCLHQEVTKEERAQIVRAMGFGQGHWFQCPNGHVYAIGECGGATETAKCNECGASIGGSNHALLSNNTHAPQMDGSRHPAWSDAANNMRNWNLDEI